MSDISGQEFKNKIKDAVKLLSNLPDGARDDLYCSEGWENIFYKQPSELIPKIQEYFLWKKENIVPGAKIDVNKAGRLMEQIALLLFKGFDGIDKMSSYQSYSAQHDLVITGLPKPAWQYVMYALSLPRENMQIVVEAKNQSKSISDQQFTRLCSVIQNKFETTAYLGVFVSRTKAAGFPNKNRRHCLEAARATQALFHAKVKKYVVVIDDDDFKLIIDGVSFVKILRNKILEVEAASGRDYSYSSSLVEHDLPKHLSVLLE